MADLTYPLSNYGLNGNSYAEQGSSSRAPNTSFSVAQAVSNLSTASNFASTSTQNGASSSATATFKAPAHKHAHHLHTIPPREKSTRTLIIDHMLWVHCRTRFAQARAELGMTDRTGGPSSSNYVHRQRPENFEEDEEEYSDGENLIMLTAREGGPGHPHNDDEDERLAKQDLSLARSLRLRAEGLEKVVTSMLEQPPPVHPILDSDFMDPPTSPNQPPRDSSHPHTLPNGVRLRILLTTVVNDLFARQAPPPPYRHQRDPANNTAQNVQDPANPSDVPCALIPLSCISAIPPPQLISFALSPPQMPAPDSNTRRYPPPSPSPRVRSLYVAGADPSTANSPPAFRCPRHLHTGCDICVEAKSEVRPSGGGRGRSGSNAGSPSDSRNAQGSNGRGKGTGSAGLSGWKDGSGIGSGLARPGVSGNVLRRRSWSMISPGDGTRGLGAGNTKLSELIPRFIRLSALVAMELGSEAREDEEGGETDSTATVTSSPAAPRNPSASAAAQNKMLMYALRPTRDWYLLLAGLLTRAVLEGYLTAGWRGLEPVECLLAVGLGISNNIDGTGIDHATGPNPQEPGDDPDRIMGDEFPWLDPDGLPSLKDAARMLFPTLRTPRDNRRQVEPDAESEFEREMTERVKRFYAIPESTPDLSTHMEDLAWTYPAEPVERAAVRFCEAIAKWRGKPELETYKKKPPESSANKDLLATPGGSTMTIESLVHSNPSSPTTSMLPSGTKRSRRLSKPSIDVYFTQPTTTDRQNGWSTASKRRHSIDDGRGGANKRLHG